jgi:hypothetical protein
MDTKFRARKWRALIALRTRPGQPFRIRVKESILNS